MLQLLSVVWWVFVVFTTNLAVGEPITSLPLCSTIEDVSRTSFEGNFTDDLQGGWTGQHCTLPSHPRFHWTSRFPRVMFIGDSTCVHLSLAFMGFHSHPKPKLARRQRLVYPLMRSTTGLLTNRCLLPFQVPRCSILKALGLSPALVWNPEGRNDTPPDRYGRKHPGCMDCSCVYQHTICLNSSLNVTFVPMDSTKDIVLQTPSHNTTQGVIFEEYFGSLKIPPSVIIFSLGPHDIPYFPPQPYAQNIREMFTKLLRHPYYRNHKVVLIWVRLVFLDTDLIPPRFKYQANDTHTRAMNAAADSVVREFGGHLIDAYHISRIPFWPAAKAGLGPSERLHSDAIHLRKYNYVFYGILSKLIGHMLLTLASQPT